MFTVAAGCGKENNISVQGGAVCDPGTYACGDGKLKRCNDDGSRLSAVMDCPSTACDPVAGICEVVGEGSGGASGEGAGPSAGGGGASDGGAPAGGAGGADPSVGGGAGVPGGTAGSAGEGAGGGGVLPPPPTTATTGASIETSGTGGFLLKGVVLLADGSVLDPGQVLVKGSTIDCVAADCTAQAGAAAVIDTNGVISPGLIDAHNHAEYGFLGSWDTSLPAARAYPAPGSAECLRVVDGRCLFDNPSEWLDTDEYAAYVQPLIENTGTTERCAMAKWAELRSLAHGTTTLQGHSSDRGCTRFLVRNADHGAGVVGYDHMRTSVGPVSSFTDSYAQSIIAAFDESTEPLLRFAVHVSEGVSGGGIENEFSRLTGMTGGHAGTSLLYKSGAILAHAMALSPAELDTVAATGTKVVWSPSSDVYLYGSTTDIDALLSRDVAVALGPNWPSSGTDNLLDELRFAQGYGVDQMVAALTPLKLWAMATAEGAEVLGLRTWLGALEVGATADITVFGRTSSDPRQAVIASTPEDVRLVMIGGDVYYGDANLSSLGRNAKCESFDACGSAKFVCLADDDLASDKGETVAEVRGKLESLMSGYGRVAELNSLVSCD